MQSNMLMKEVKAERDHRKQCSRWHWEVITCKISEEEKDSASQFCKIKISFFFHYLSDNEAIWGPNASSSEILRVSVISTLITYTHCSLTARFRTVSILLILKETTCLGHCSFEKQFAQIPVFTKKLESELCYYKFRVTNDWILLRVYWDINLDTAYLLLGTVFRLQGKVPPLKTLAINCGNWFETDRTS